MIEENEIWIDVKGYEFLYKISNLGNIKSLKREVSNGNGTRIIKEKLLKPVKDDIGRLNIALWKNNKYKNFKLSRLVLVNFVGECPEGMECCHNDGDCQNNNLNNLRWDSRKNNVLDKFKHETMLFGEKITNSKLKEFQVVEILELLKTKNYSQIEISKIYNVSQVVISKIKNKKLWKHLNNSIF